MYGELLRLAKIKEAAGKVANLDVVEARANLNDAQSQVFKIRLFTARHVVIWRG